MSRWPGYLPGVQDYEMRTRDEAKPHAPTRAELEDLFRDAVASRNEARAILRDVEDVK